MGSMNADVVIRARGLGKRYRLGRPSGSYTTLRESLSGLASAPVRKLRALVRGESVRRRAEMIWALKDVDLDVGRGEVFGIIGRNGAGKSTLLKILSRITEPTTGRVEVVGRVGSLLEVGTGFHPELTGRENIYLNGAILGMRKSEIDRRFEEIVAFAEVELFLDTPVKRYSSGMYIRLAFSVAAHMEPEILLVDEVLAVGDATFQKKCLGKIDHLAHSSGRTVLVVSHNMQLIRFLCARTAWIDSGSVVEIGPTSTIVSRYFSSGPAPASTVDLSRRVERTGAGRARVERVSLFDSRGEPSSTFQVGSSCTIGIAYRTNHLGGSAAWAMSLFDSLGVKVSHLDSVESGACLHSLRPRGEVLLTIPEIPLSPGRYLADLRLVSEGQCMDYIQAAFALVVEPGDFFGTGRLTPAHDAAVFLPHSWTDTDGAE